MPRQEAVEMLSQSATIHLASTSANNEPILRCVNAVVLGDKLYFHGAPAGEKMETMGRPVVLSVEEIVASIPSYWLDPQRACPATTLYRSVQVHGILEIVENQQEKAAALEGLMKKYQPEGGYKTIEHNDPLYKKAIEGLLVVAVSLEQLDGKAKLAQNRSEKERTIIMERLWQRGDGLDMRAIELIRKANLPESPPALFQGPDDTIICVAPNEKHAQQAAELLKDTYWNDQFSTDTLYSSHMGSQAWVVALDKNGDVVGSARAISDGAKRAWIYDVIVASEWRKKKVGEKLMTVLLDHPQMRNTKIIALATKDAQRFYSRLGFVEKNNLPPRGYTSTEMALQRE